jgi:hypothetical protein
LKQFITDSTEQSLLESKEPPVMVALLMQKSIPNDLPPKNYYPTIDQHYHIVSATVWV